MEGATHLQRGNIFLRDGNLQDAISEWKKAAEFGLEDAYRQLWRYSPRAYDFEKSPQEAKTKVINGVKGILSKMKEPTFENLLRHVIEVKGREVANNIFKSLEYGWEKNGYLPVDYCEVYYKVFSELSSSDELQSTLQQEKHQFEIKDNRKIEPQNNTSKIRQFFDKHNDDIAQAYVYSILISAVFGSLIRFIINRAIPTWLIYLGVFIGSLFFTKKYEG